MSNGSRISAIAEGESVIRAKIIRILLQLNKAFKGLASIFKYHRLFSPLRKKEEKKKKRKKKEEKKRFI